MHKAHDHSYKLLFLNPEMIIDLLKGFVHEPWVNELDFNTLEIVSGSYVTDDLRSREDDIIWMKRVLLRQIRRRFDEETAFKAQAIIMAIKSPDTLETIGDYIIDCDNGEEFLVKLESLK